MRGNTAKEPTPARATRSSSVSKMTKSAERSKRTPTPSKTKTKPPKPKKTPEKKPPKQSKPVPKKTTSKPKETIKTIGGEEAEPVELVIQLKKPTAKKNKEPAKKGVASGKVGKRKTKGPIKKETLKKAAKSAEKEELINTVIKVAVRKSVVPIKIEPKEPKVKPKEKQKKEKNVPKKVIKKEPKKTIEIKKEPKVKEIKKEKEDKVVKQDKGTKHDKMIKQEKESKQEKVIKQEKVVIKEEKAAKQEKPSRKEEGKGVNMKQAKTDDKKKTTKPKTKPKETKVMKKSDEPKKKEVDEVVTIDSDDEVTIKQIKPRVKIEKLSPITVQDDGDSDFSPSLSAPSTSKRDSSWNSSLSKSQVVIKVEKPDPEPGGITKAPKAKVQRKKPGRKPAIKIKEEPVFNSLVFEKRHREASLNALAKVHCLYENESRGAMNEMLDKSVMKRKEDIKVEKVDPSDKEEDDEPEVVPDVLPARTLRSAPGMRGVGRHLDILNAMSTSSSSEDDEQLVESSKEECEGEREAEEQEAKPPDESKPEEKKVVRRRRKRTELMMDLKDMVVRKRMASLNASAMMAASYSVERRDRRRPGRSSDDSTSSAVGDSSDDDAITEDSGNQVALIVNQDTDLTITGLYTRRSTVREGICSIAGMHYRISSTSHTQTEATAVSTELIHHTTDHVSVSHSESGGSVEAGGTSSPGGSVKSYTPLGALSSMQPPGQSRPMGSSAFTAPPPYHHPHSHSHHPAQEIHAYSESFVFGQGSTEDEEDPYIDITSLDVEDLDEVETTSDEAPPNFIGYYQPAGPLISTSSGTSKTSTPEPPYPYASYTPAYDYPGYYRSTYRRPWASSSQMEYIETTAYPALPHPTSYYHYPPPPPPPPAPPAPPPVCYSQPPRLPFMEQPFSPCPSCPSIQSCPKNVHTGPLTGASKGSEMTEAQPELATLRPVVLALPQEPAGASPGPPSPARGSAGMPPPASPALSTARNNRWSPPEAGLVITMTTVDSPPPAATSPPMEPAPALPVPCKRAIKRESSDAPEVTRKRKKSSGTKANRGNKAKMVITIKTENNNVSKHNHNLVDNSTAISETPLRKTPSLRWSNGWSWEGEPYNAKVFLTTEDTGAMRKCYPAMRHRQGDIIRPRDCILLKSSGPRKALPFVAKVSAMWENPDDGEMMVSVLWYYRPEHTEQGRTPDQPADEIFASRHKDTNSVACIEDKCYVLTYFEYCRYRKHLMARGRKMNNVVPPIPDGYPRASLIPPGQVASDLVFFCRQVYDFRQKKVLKKPPTQPSSRA